MNCDETFLPLNETKEKAVTIRNTKTVYSQSMGSTEHITMLCAGSAAGAALPPMIFIPQSFPGRQYRFGWPDDSVYAKSDSGWLDSEFVKEPFELAFSMANIKNGFEKCGFFRLIDMLLKVPRCFQEAPSVGNGSSSVSSSAHVGVSSEAGLVPHDILDTTSKQA